MILDGAGFLLPRNIKHRSNVYFSRDWSIHWELSDGKAHEYMIDEETLIEDCGLTYEKCVACVWDVTGRKYWSHRIMERLLKLGRIH